MTGKGVGFVLRISRIEECWGVMDIKNIEE
jgi:hypothetical protein